MLTWRTRNSPYLPLHKEAQNSQHQAQLTMGVSRQTDMGITKDTRRQEQEGRECSHGHCAGQAGVGHSLGAHPPHQGISGGHSHTWASLMGTSTTPGHPWWTYPHQGITGGHTHTWASLVGTSTTPGHHWWAYPHQGITGRHTHLTRASASHCSYPSACPDTISAGSPLLVRHCTIHLW